jgi:hypothetical protein
MIAWAVPGIPWPRLGTADPGMVTLDALRLAEHLLWCSPEYLLRCPAGAVRGHPRHDAAYWDAEDVRLLELVADSDPWFDASYGKPGWLPQRDARLAYVAFAAARAVCCVPELLTTELTRRGATPTLDARFAAVRHAGREIGWRAAEVRRVATRREPFNPITAALVCQWLIDARLSTTRPA